MEENLRGIGACITRFERDRIRHQADLRHKQLVPKALLDFESLSEAQDAPIQDQAGRISHPARHVEDPGRPGRRSVQLRVHSSIFTMCDRPGQSTRLLLL